MAKLNKNDILYYLYGDKYIRKMQFELEIMKKEQILGFIKEEEIEHYNKEYKKEVDPVL